MKPRRLSIEPLEGRELMAGDFHELMAETVVSPPKAHTAKTSVEAATMATQIPVAQGRSQFVLQAVNRQNVSDSLLAKSDGLALRITWAALEPTNNKYNWAFLDQQMARADRLGKPVQFIFLAGDDAPAWLGNLGIRMTSGIPTPWDTRTQTQYREVATAIAAHLGQTGTLDRLTHIYTPGANSAEMHYRNESGFYEQPGYSDANLIAGQMGFARTLAAAFPQSIVVSTLGDHNRAWAPKLIAQMKAELRGQIGFQINSLSARTSTDYAGYVRVKQAAAEGFHAGFQALSASTADRFGGSYEQYYQKFLATKATWLQDYSSDIF